jgi:selenocysteine lyase/cysteine desulfurase
MKRKTFLQSLGLGVLGAGASSTWAGAFHLPKFEAGSADDYWSAVQAGYDFAPGYRYFNSGGLGPSLRAVREATDAVAAELEALVETGHERLGPARERVAAYFGAQADEVAFVRNATEGNGIVAGGLQLSAGDEVIFESHAHPGGSFPWMLQAERRGVAVRLFEPDPESVTNNLERIRSLVTPRTRVIQVSHITAPTGIKFPIEKIAAYCRRQGIWFHVDGAQSAGMIPVNFAAMDCDSYATSGHKWVGAPRETGVLLVKRDRQEDLRPIMVGAYSGDLPTLPGPIEYYPGAMRYEYGTRDVPRMLGMVEAMDWQERIGRERIAQHGRELVKQLWAGLRDVPDLELISPDNDTLGSSMFSIRSPRISYRDLFRVLRSRHNMRCRPVSERGLDAVRISCHVFNTSADIDRLMEAIVLELRKA